VVPVSVHELMAGIERRVPVDEVGADAVGVELAERAEVVGVEDGWLRHFVYQ